MQKLMKLCVILISICAAGAAGFAAGRFTRTSMSAKEEYKAAATMDPIASFREERQKNRQMQISQLNEIIHSASEDSQIIALAQARQMDLLEWMDKESVLEGILKMRGFEEALTTVQTDSVNVFLCEENISQQQAAIILELVMRETGISEGNVKIIPIK